MELSRFMLNTVVFSPIVNPVDNSDYLDAVDLSLLEFFVALSYVDVEIVAVELWKGLVLYCVFFGVKGYYAHLQFSFHPKKERLWAPNRIVALWCHKDIYFNTLCCESCVEVNEDFYKAQINCLAIDF